MKKIIVLAGLTIGAALFTTVDVSAQNRMKPLLDTSTNSTTRNIVTDVILNETGSLSLQYVGTKLSGTVGGKVYLEGSNDGANFPSSQIIDSLTLADQTTNTKIFDVSQKRRLKYRFRVVTSGSQSLVNKGYWLEVKEE